MKGHEITYLIKQRGKRVTDIAALFGVRTNAVSQVIHGYAVSKRIRMAISQCIGIPISDLWPESAAELEQKNTSAPAGRNRSSDGDGGRAPDPSRG